MPRFSHSDYYRDRNSESELCRDFPGDEILIHGLRAMQTHMWSNGVNIDIPIMRVMNTAHFLAAYMFATTCTGDQTEYDALADISLGRDKQLFRVAVIVLAAMLKRTDGFRARRCRNMLLDNRDSDFDEGVALYDRFLRNAEKRFAEEDFLIDTQQLIKQINEQKEIIALQNKQISSLKFTITTMAEQKQQTIVYNYGTYNDIHDNPNATIYACPENKQTEDVTPEKPATMPPDFFCVSERFSEENIRARLAAELKQATTKIDYCRALYRLQHIGCININQYASDAQRAIVFNNYQDTYKLSASDFCKARMVK